MYRRWRTTLELGLERQPFLLAVIITFCMGLATPSARRSAGRRPDGMSNET